MRKKRRASCLPALPALAATRRQPLFAPLATQQAVEVTQQAEGKKVVELQQPFGGKPAMGELKILLFRVVCFACCSGVFRHDDDSCGFRCRLYRLSTLVTPYQFDLTPAWPCHPSPEAGLNPGGHGHAQWVAPPRRWGGGGFAIMHRHPLILFALAVWQHKNTGRYGCPPRHTHKSVNGFTTDRLRRWLLHISATASKQGSLPNGSGHGRAHRVAAPDFADATAVLGRIPLRCRRMIIQGMYLRSAW